MGIFTAALSFLCPLPSCGVFHCSIRISCDVEMGMMDDDLLLMVRSGVCSGGGGTTREGDDL